MRSSSKSCISSKSPACCQRDLRGNVVSLETELAGTIYTNKKCQCKENSNAYSNSNYQSHLNITRRICPDAIDVPSVANINTQLFSHHNCVVRKYNPDDKNLDY